MCHSQDQQKHAPVNVQVTARCSPRRWLACGCIQNQRGRQRECSSSTQFWENMLNSARQETGLVLCNANQAYMASQHRLFHNCYTSLSDWFKSCWHKNGSWARCMCMFLGRNPGLSTRTCNLSGPAANCFEVATKPACRLSFSTTWAARFV